MKLCKGCGDTDVMNLERMNIRDTCTKIICEFVISVHLTSMIFIPDLKLCPSEALNRTVFI